MRIRTLVPCLVISLLSALTIGCSGTGGSSRASNTTALVSTSVAATTTTSLRVTTTSLQATTTQLSPAERLLRQMDARQKAAQVLMLTIDGTALSPSTQALLVEGPPGGILLLERNVTGAAQVRALTADLQREVSAVGSGVGLFIAVDQEGGSVQRIRDGVPILPAARSLGDKSSPAEAGRLASATATGLLALGVNMNLAPVADVVDDKTSFLYSRTYGGEATKVAAFVAAVTEAFGKAGLISVVKHFPGHGSASGDTHGQRVVSNASRGDFETVHLPPFRAAIGAGAEGVMTAHLVATVYDPERPASQSSVIIGGLLRGDLGFSGLVVSDDLAMVGAGAVEPGEAAVASLAAGCDLLIYTGAVPDQLKVLDAIVSAVGNGRLAPSRLDQAVLQRVGHQAPARDSGVPTLNLSLISWGRWSGSTARQGNCRDERSPTMNHRLARSRRTGATGWHSLSFALVCLVVVAGLSLSSCGGGSPETSSTETSLGDATSLGEGASTTTQAVSSDPGKLGDAIAATWVEAMQKLNTLIQSKPEATAIRGQVERLKEEYIGRLVELGRQREALSANDKAQVVLRTAAGLNAVSNETWYADYMTLYQHYSTGDQDFANLLASFNILTQYAEFDLLKKQSPEEAARLGIN